MPRAPTILQSEFPYNISARCINREWFQIPMENVWNIFCEELADTIQKHNLQVHSFVLMSNHYHLIASTPDSNISQCMHRFMGRTSRRLTTSGNRINETFAGRHYKTILQHQNYYLNAYKYNFRNPVGAGICEKVEDYPFSTLQTEMGKRNIAFPLAADFTNMGNSEAKLDWLNIAPPPEKLEAVRYALKRQYFTSKKCRKNNKPIMGIHDLL